MPIKSNLVIKRIFDILISASGLLVLFPLFIFIGISILIDDYGPVFFKHKRIGRGGKPFYMYKFRTMRALENKEDGLFGPGDFNSVTKLGKFLRRTKINEIPQLINVLKGEMSLVGPRPEVEKWVAIYPERWSKVLTVRPGITDKASIFYWNEEYILEGSGDQERTYREIILPKKLDIYEDYVENCSLSNDIRLILATASIFLFRNGNSRIKLETKHSYSDIVSPV